MLEIYNRRNIAIKITALLFIPLFLCNNLSFSQTHKSINSTLSPHLISELLCDYEKEQAEGKAEDFSNTWCSIYAEGLVEKLLKRAEERGHELSLDDIERELINQIRLSFAASENTDRIEKVRAVGRQVITNTLARLNLNQNLNLNDYIELTKRIDEETDYDTDGSLEGELVLKTGRIEMPLSLFDINQSFFITRYAHEVMHWLQRKGYSNAVYVDWPNKKKSKTTRSEVMPVAVEILMKLQDEIDINSDINLNVTSVYKHFSGIFSKMIEDGLGDEYIAKEVKNFYVQWAIANDYWTYDDPPRDFEEVCQFVEEDIWQRFNGFVVATFAHRYSETTGRVSDMWKYLRVYANKGGKKLNLISELSSTQTTTTRTKPTEILDQENNALRFTNEVEMVIAMVRKKFSRIRTEKTRRINDKTGHLAGFGEEELGIDEYGIDLHDLLNQATRSQIEQVQSVRIGVLIKNKSKLSRLTAEEQNLNIYSIENWINEFRELYRKALAEKGLSEPEREEMIRKTSAQIIAHPSTYSGRNSIYIDDLYFRIISLSDNADDLFISLTKHEALHIGSPNLTETEVNAQAPINNIREAIKKRTVLIVQSGGDCAGLNAVVGTAAQELGKMAWCVIGVREGFAGLLAETFEKYHIPIDGPMAARLITRPSTDLKSSREDPFKIVADIIKNKQNASGKKAYNLLMKIETINNWRKLSAKEKGWLNALYKAMGSRAKTGIDKFVRTMKNIEGYGGIIVTGGDDHCKVAMILARLRKGKKGSCIAIPKSVDADAMVQMLGFKTASQHIQERFWQAAVTGQGEKKVFVGEIMGRKAGWLTLAVSDRRAADNEKLRDSVGAKKADAVKDTIISIIPEKKVSIQSIILRAKEILSKKGALNIAVSEGFSIKRDDPLLDELVAKNPIIAAKIAGKAEADVHGHMRLAGASEFICAILVTEWNNPELRLGLSWNQLRHTIFGYIGRGLKPNAYDVRMARQYAKKAVELINDGKSGLMVAYSDMMDPLKEEPQAMAAEDVLTLNGKKFPRNLETLGEHQSAEVREWFKLSGYPEGFRIYSDQELIEAGVIMEKDGKVISYDVEEGGIIAKETLLDFDLAVKMLREDFISTAVSAWAHKRGSIFEVPENSEAGLMTMAIADKNPVDYDKWDAEDIASWEKVKNTIMILLPENGISFGQILEEAARLKLKHGVVNIAIASNYVFSMNDPFVKKLLDEDPYLKAKFDLSNPNFEGTAFTIKDVSEFIQGGLVKYYPEAFPTVSHARCNQLNNAYHIRYPKPPIRSVYKERILESRREETDATIKDIEALTSEIANHMLLGSESPVNTTDTMVLMRSNLVESISSNTSPLLKNEYTIMKQRLRKIFYNGEGLEEFVSNEELLDRAKNLLRRGTKVIILDDTSIGAGIINALQTAAGKENGKDFCVIAANKIYNEGSRSLFFVNLPAMALMGVAMLQDGYDGMRLFNLAYKLFTGQEAPKDLLKQFKEKELWVMTVPPKMLKLTGTLADREDIKRLFASAA